MPSPASIDLTHLDLAPIVRGARTVTAAVAHTATNVAKDATYTTVGLGVLTYQRLQVRRREFERALRDA